MTIGQYPRGDAAGESFCKATARLSKLRRVYQMREGRIKELRDAKVVTAQHVDTTTGSHDFLTGVRPLGDRGHHTSR